MINKVRNKSLKIMIIEDEYDILLLYKDYLTSKGHRVIFTSLNAANIMIEYEKLSPDISLIDYQLPDDNDGLQLSKLILSRYPSSSILIVTAYDTVNDKILSDHFFVDKNIHVVVKPIKLSELENRIYNIISVNPRKSAA